MRTVNSEHSTQFTRVVYIVHFAAPWLAEIDCQHIIWVIYEHIIFYEHIIELFCNFSWNHMLGYQYCSRYEINGAVLIISTVSLFYALPIDWDPS